MIEEEESEQQERKVILENQSRKEWEKHRRACVSKGGAKLPGVEEKVFIKTL